MKIFNWGNGLFILALLAVLYALFEVFGARAGLQALRLETAVLAAASYMLGALFWNLAWGRYFGLGNAASIRLGIAAQVGGLTPFSLGADFLRGMLVKAKGMKFIQGFAASLAAKFHKILVAMAFSALGVGALLYGNTGLRGSLLLGLGVPVLMLLGIYFLTRSYLARIVPALSMEKIPQGDARKFSKLLGKYIKLRDGRIFLFLLLSLVSEFLAFVLSFSSVGIVLDLPPFYLIFVLLFFASKGFFVPQGIGITELLGLFLLGSVSMTSGIAAALLVWNIVRIWVPTVISGMAAMGMKVKLISA